MAVSIMATLTIHAQVTTSAMGGSIRSASGEPLTGASVKATHVPTGTVISAMTSANGRFTFANIQPGGPYTVEVSFVGYKPQTRKDVYLELGETGRVDFSLISNSQDLKEVVVTASKGAQALNGGVGTSISAERLQNLPTVGRSLTDFYQAYASGQNNFWRWYLHRRSK